MKIKIVGAAGGEVAGSAYFVQTERAKISVDAGMFQGGKKSEAKNRLPAGVNVSKLDAILSRMLISITPAVCRCSLTGTTPDESSQLAQP